MHYICCSTFEIIYIEILLIFNQYFQKIERTCKESCLYTKYYIGHTHTHTHARA